MNEGLVRSVVVVGGGTAGWLSACLLAAEARDAAGRRMSVTLVESPDVPTIGVGEGTWPTMRRTLSRIGIDEARFLLTCDASFKQGSRFDGWTTGHDDDVYYHPFVPPPPLDARDLVAAWSAYGGGRFADAVSAQPAACAANLAPRQRRMPGYAGALNYAYHLNAGKFAEMLARHGVEALGVRHVRDHVIDVERSAGGDVAAVSTREHGSVEGDFFLDCTGQAALLIGRELAVPLVDRSGELFNDRALAVQLPVASRSPIASQTTATAHAAGWIWDIGLPSRRGIGCVYASAFMDDDDAAEVLTAYIRRTAPDGPPPPEFRAISFRSGHRERFWVNNCLALGLSAGFLEPLEASAIVLIELSLDALLANLPFTRGVMDVQARRFNELFRYRWDRIVEFLKLHYVLSRRDEPYWRAHRDPATVPRRLADELVAWTQQPPSAFDLPHADEVFPPASYQYVLYGMGASPPSPGRSAATIEAAAAAIHNAAQRGRALSSELPTNRAYLDAIVRDLTNNMDAAAL